MRILGPYPPAKIPLRPGNSCLPRTRPVPATSSDHTINAGVGGPAPDPSTGGEPTDHDHEPEEGQDEHGAEDECGHGLRQATAGITTGTSSISLRIYPHND